MKRQFITCTLVSALAMASGVVYAESIAKLQVISERVKVGMEQALQSVVKTVPGKVIEIELDDGDGQDVRYEADVLTPTGESVEVWVNGVTGQAHVHEQNGQAKRKDKERAQAAKIDIQQAIQAANAHVEGKPVKAELDNHWGQVSYQVDILQPNNTLLEVKIDAVDAKVLRTKRD